MGGVVVFAVALCALVGCTINTGPETGTASGRSTGAACDADGDCASGECVKGAGEGEEGEEVASAGTCAAPKPGTGTTPAAEDDGSCKSGTSTIKDGEQFCESNTLYKCLGGKKSLLEDCDSCKYIGAGTGSKYNTSCRTTLSPNANSQQKSEWNGPGCYFGYSQIC